MISPNISGGKFLILMRFFEGAIRLLFKASPLVLHIFKDRLSKYIQISKTKYPRDDNLIYVRNMTKLENSISAELTNCGINNANKPILIWFHGGGFVLNGSILEYKTLYLIAKSLDIIVLSLDYSLSPECPFPAGLNDGYRTIKYIAENSSRLGIDANRIMVGGASAGGGLAAALALYTRDMGGPKILLQLLLYPMLDDRTGGQDPPRQILARNWTAQLNKDAWAAYLGFIHTGRPSIYAAPARAPSLARLPPAWIGVGSDDLFLEENAQYAERLNVEGSFCELKISPSQKHGFDALEPDTDASKNFRNSYMSFLNRHISGDW
jgi:acetyl esterase/lipase